MRAAARLLDQGRLREAEAAARELARRDPGNADAWQVLALARSGQGWWGDAVEAWGRCTQLLPREALVHARLGIALTRAGRAEEAAAAIERALALDARHPVALRARLEWLERSGPEGRKEAADLARPLAERLAGGSPDGDLDPELAAAVAAALLRGGDPEAAIAAARGLLERRDLPVPVARGVGFTLGRALAKTGRADEAFAAWAEANRRGLPPGPIDLGPLERLVERSVETFTPEAMAGLPRGADATGLPVLVVGMPRSGSTLVEQVLDAHPLAWGAGETPAWQDAVRDMQQALGPVAREHPYPGWVPRLGPRAMAAPVAGYLEALRRARPKGGPRGADARAIDKNLLNFRHLGLAALALPGATILHCVRDPVETGLSCFMNELSPAAFPWAGDLEAIGRFHRLKDRLMRHWREVLGDRVVDVVYEELVAEPEPGIRRIVEACGLPWDDACLDFHRSGRTVTTLSWDQVNRPIYREAVRRSEAYGHRLDPLRRALAAD